MLEVSEGSAPFCPTLVINPYAVLSVIDAAAYARVTRLRVALALQRGELAFTEIDGRRMTSAAWIEDWQDAK